MCPVHFEAAFQIYMIKKSEIPPPSLSFLLYNLQSFMTYTLIQTTSGEKIAGILEQKQEIDPSRPRPRLILIAHGSLGNHCKSNRPCISLSLPNQQNTKTNFTTHCWLRNFPTRLFALTTVVLATVAEKQDTPTLP